MADRYILQDLRQAVLERDNYTCQYCGCSGEDANLEIDHIIPLSKGGINDMRNLVTACERCNRSKHSKILCAEELRALADKINSSVDFLMGLIDPEAKPSIDKADRVQISAYFNNELYEAVKDLALYSDTSISDIIINLCENFVASNNKTLQEFREYKSNKRKLIFH